MKPLPELSKILHESQPAVGKAIAESLGSLIDKEVTLDVVNLNEDSGRLHFGKGPFVQFGISDQDGEPLAGALLLDLEAAVHLGAAFSLMGEQQTEEVLEGGTIPDVLMDAISESANILTGAFATLIREEGGGTPSFRRAETCERFIAKPWPDLLVRLDAEVRWNIFATTLVVEKVPRGRLIVLASDGESGDFGVGDSFESTGEAALPIAGLRAALASEDATDELKAFMESLAGLGLETQDEAWSADEPAPDLLVLSGDDAESLSETARAALARDVSTDQLLVVSAAPTKELVLAVRELQIDSFLVLPADPERLGAQLQRMLRRAAERAAEPEPALA